MKDRCTVVCIWAAVLTAVSHGGPTSEYSLTFHLLEEQPTGTLVGNLSESVRVLFRLEPELRQKLEFQLIIDNIEEDGVAKFDVEADSGLLVTRQRMDREHICPSSSKMTSQRDGVCVILLQVRVSPVDLVGDVEVHVVIDDINDNDPYFASAAVEVSFPETATSGTLIQLPTATDLDAGQNGWLNYELIQPSDVFDLVLLGDADASDVFLRLWTFVDRETQSVFSTTLVAKDTGNPSRTGCLSVTVAVTDANDHAPKFNATYYEFTTTENLPTGSVIGRVRATDLDEGDNARVMYAVTRINGNDPGDGGPLTVDTDTGEVVVVGQLDFERYAVYVLTIAAADCAAPQLRQFGYVRVIVHVLDENDNAPKLTIYGSTTAEMTENRAIGTTVLELSVFDADSGEAGQIKTCHVADAEDRNKQPPFSLRRNSALQDHYSLVTAAVLDREIRDRYSLVIVCLDAGVPPLTGQIVVDICLLDVNDNTPTFLDAAPISVSLQEGNGVDSYVTTIKTDDADLGDNGTVSYSLQCFGDVQNSSSSVLYINNVTGVIRAAVTLDRERQAGYNCVVVVADCGRPSLSSTMQLQLTVADIDDEQAFFEHHAYEFQVADNLPAGSVVGRVKAQDADEPPFNRVLYFLGSHADNSSVSLNAAEDSNSDSDRLFPFHVNQRTGVISIRRQLDRKNDGSYFRFDVVAGSLTGAHFVVSDRGNVEVHVIAGNLNSPTILFPICNVDVDFRDCELQIVTLSAGEVVTRVVAVDADDDNQQVRYELIGDASAQRLFHVNSTSGEIHARRDIGPHLTEYGGSIHLKVRVTDARIPPLMSTVMFVVLLNATRHQRLAVNDRATAPNIALPLILVAAAVVVVMVICFLAARRIGPLDRSPEMRHNTTYVSAPAAYISQTSIDDMTCGADCSTDVALGSSSTLRLQRLQIPAVIVDSGSSAVDVTSPRRCALRDWSADVTCHDTGRVVVIQDRDVCRAKRLSTSYQARHTWSTATSRRASSGQQTDGHLRHSADRQQDFTDHRRRMGHADLRLHCDALGYRRGESHVIADDDLKMHIGDLSSTSVDDDRCATETATRSDEVDDQFARRRCAPCNIRQVALGAIVAGHLYNDNHRAGVDDVEAANVPTERTSLYL